MRALSIRQPWAHRILHDGKDIENRTWATSVRGPILIHAGVTIDCDAAEVHEKDMPRGGVVGICEIVDCITSYSDPRAQENPWFCGDYGFVLANPRPLPLIRCPGRLSFFTPNIEGEVLRLWGEGKLLDTEAAEVLSMSYYEFLDWVTTPPDQGARR